MTRDMAPTYAPCEVCGEPTRSRYKVCYPREGVSECRAEYQRRAHQRARLENLCRLAEDQDWTCGWCKKPLPRNLDRVHEDHIIPRINGGPVRPRWNRQAVHGWCNQEKGNIITAVAHQLAQEHGIKLTTSQRQRYERFNYSYDGPWYG